MTKEKLLSMCKTATETFEPVNIKLNNCGVDIVCDDEAVNGEKPGFILTITNEDTITTGDELEYCAFTFEQVEEMVNHIFNLCKQ